MNWVDYVLLVIVALSGIHGLRLGAAMQVLTFGGLLLGLFLGALLAPSVAKVAHGGTAKALVAIDRPDRRGHVRGRPRTVAGGALGTTPAPAASRSGRLGLRRGGGGGGGAHRHVGRGDDPERQPVLRARPVPAAVAHRAGPRRRASAHPHGLRRGRAVPRPERLPHRLRRSPAADRGPGVACPPTPSARAAVLRAEGSTVQVAGQGCGVIQEGSGFVVAPGLVVTNAHVVAGIPSPAVIDSDRSPRHDGGAVRPQPRHRRAAGARAHRPVPARRRPPWWRAAPPASSSGIPAAARSRRARPAWPPPSRPSGSTSTGARRRPARSTSSTPWSSPATRAAPWWRRAIPGSRRRHRHRRGVRTLDRQRGRGIRARHARRRARTSPAPRAETACREHRQLRARRSRLPAPGALG